MRDVYERAAVGRACMANVYPVSLSLCLCVPHVARGLCVPPVFCAGMCTKRTAKQRAKGRGCVRARDIHEHGGEGEGLRVYTCGVHAG